MSKYIDAEKLIAEIERLKSVLTDPLCSQGNILGPDWVAGGNKMLNEISSAITSLQQEQPNDVCAEIKEYYGKELAFEDERAKAAYHFFSAGKAFELREYEEERKKHITDLLDNSQKGMNAGYEKAISELKNKEFLNESEQVFVDLVTERMLREGPIPTLNGEQKIAFEKEFNRFKQITGMINWPGYIEVYKKVILWFMAWGADKLPNLGKPIDPTKIDIQQERPEQPCEDLNEAAEKYAYTGIPDEMKYIVKPLAEQIIEYFKAGAEWQKKQMLKDAKDGYVSAIIIHNDGDEEHYAVTYPNGERPHSITDKVKIIIL